MARLSMLLRTALSIATLLLPALARADECRRIDVTSAPKYDDDERRSFSALRVLDLYPWVVLPPARRGDRDDESEDGDMESAQFELRYFGPNRHLYQSVSFPVSFPVEEDAAARSVEGYPRPVRAATKKVVLHRGLRRRIVAAPPLPVAGTSIVTSSLYGRWRVEVWVEGGRRPVCSTAFRLRP